MLKNHSVRLKNLSVCVLYFKSQSVVTLCLIQSIRYETSNEKTFLNNDEYEVSVIVPILNFLVCLQPVHVDFEGM